MYSANIKCACQGKMEPSQYAWFPTHVLTQFFISRIAENQDSDGNQYQGATPKAGFLTTIHDSVLSVTYLYSYYSQ